MNPLKFFLLERLSRYAHRRGIDIYIEDFSFKKGLSLKNTDIDACGERILIENLLLKIRIKELFRKRIAIDMTSENITVMPGYLSNKDFHLPDLKGNISYEKRRKSTSIDVTLNQAIHLSLKHTGNADEGELFIKTSLLSIDRYKQLFDGHIISRFMNTVYSDTLITFLCCYKYGHTSPYPKFNSTFQYDALKIHPENCALSKMYLTDELSKRNHLAKNYKKLEEIPEIIRQTVICTEDPSFNLHRGISPTLTGMTLKSAIDQKALKRGGSTISMQLIKNALLNGERTFTRKTEEAILTLLMENHYGTGKQDILEIYLNMIEFAPDVYGIEDAALFYFDKSSSKLNAIEVIVLTYIIPRPIHFYEALQQKTEQLRRNLLQHIRQYLPVMMKKQIIHRENVSSADIKQIEFSDKFGVLVLDIL
ncbi:biosynthetic peptidoglycan transglycosylase [Bacteroides heparinolyticus]|uniref:biosynthetic peptidoglycan transglycosylase n=1 Tax=Prevotella heparinolytica TaxID=28113 RepID=UPI003FA058BF